MGIPNLISWAAFKETTRKQINDITVKTACIH